MHCFAPRFIRIHSIYKFGSNLYKVFIVIYYNVEKN